MQSEPTIFTPEERAQLVAQLRAERALEHLAAKRPGLLIEPHDHGQLQALCSDHVYRILIPGNGWGKTTCMGLDCDLLMQRDDPFKPQVMPEAMYGVDRPTVAVWFCQKYQQFEIMKPDLEAIFTRGWRWREDKHVYVWPNGSKCFVLSSDSDWTAIQGVHVDAVYFDEHPDRKFWNEMQYRRRGKHKTRYMVAATMTLGITWFVTGIIQPVEEHARQLGLTHDEFLQRQPHPTTFLWDVGGIADNPAMTEDDEKHYASIETASDKEREVRLRGGYADFTGMPVFDLAALTAMEQRALEHPAGGGENGAIVFVPDATSDPQVETRFIRAAAGTAMGHRFAGVKDREFFRWVPGAEVEGGRITIYEPPDPEQADNYVIGADFAAGLVGMDYDAAVVGLKTADGQVRQVAEAMGHWGDVFFAEVLYMLGVLYFEAFIVGERQFGLPCMRRLYDEMGYTYLYHQRQEEKRHRRMSDLLGHHRGSGDTIIPLHRLAVKRGDVELVSRDAIRQHKRYQFKPRNKTDEFDDLENSAQLTTGAPNGENDDLVMAAAYMMHGAREVVHFRRPPRKYRPGSFGDVMELEKTLNPGPRGPTDPYTIRR